jgi:hypothetical protein
MDALDLALQNIVRDQVLVIHAFGLFRTMQGTFIQIGDRKKSQKSALRRMSASPPILLKSRLIGCRCPDSLLSRVEGIAMLGPRQVAYA